LSQQVSTAVVDALRTLPSTRPANGRGNPGHVVWIGLFEPSPGLLARIGEQLGLHYLAIEDAGKAHQRPKIEQYGDASSSSHAQRRSLGQE
jgi:Mg2+ and Co2+ transporter CorA